MGAGGAAMGASGAAMGAGGAAMGSRVSIVADAGGGMEPWTAGAGGRNPPPMTPCKLLASSKGTAGAPFTEGSGGR